MDEKVVISLPLSVIHDDEQFNCRGKIIPLDVMDLAKNIQEQGLIQPVIVRPDRVHEGQYILVAGFRRFLAHKINKAIVIDAIVREDLDDPVKAKLFNLSENLARKDLSLMQEAKAIWPLYVKDGMTQQEIADRLNVSRSWVQLRVNALKFDAVIQKDIEEGWVTTDLIPVLHGLPKDEQYAIIKSVKEQKQAAKDQGKRIKVKMSKTLLKKDPTKRLRRDPAAIERMTEHIVDAVGANFGTRCLAWASGNISSEELFDDIETLADEKGEFYTPPVEDI